MSMGSINNERSTWGLSSSPAAGAATFGAKTADSGFEEALKNSLGFGSKDSSGERINTISASKKADDILSQLQLSFLKNNSVNSLDSRINNSLL